MARKKSNQNNKIQKKENKYCLKISLFILFFGIIIAFILSNGPEKVEPNFIKGYHFPPQPSFIEQQRLIIRDSILNFIGKILKFFFEFYSSFNLPIVDGQLKISGLSNPVYVLRDKFGVPHFKAENFLDLITAQGFVVSQDRFWQMELLRRVSQGGLSSLFGSEALEVDRFYKTLGLSHLARKQIKKLTEIEISILNAYTNGINQFLNHPSSSLPIECNLLSIKPKPWTPEDTLTISLLFTHQLEVGWRAELGHLNFLEKLANWSSHFDLSLTQFPTLTVNDFISKNIKNNNNNNNDNVNESNFDPTGTTFGGGSNSWAVSGKYTKTGFPILASDPHLFLGTPSVWYENHLQTTGPENVNIAGVSFPGVPGILIGHNDHIAWGITISIVDTADLFFEEFGVWNNNTIVEQLPYRHLDKWIEAEVSIEEIQVKGQSEPYKHRVVKTRHGPIISEFLVSSAVGSLDTITNQNTFVRVALQATCFLEENTNLIGFLKLATATNWTEFREAVSLIQNNINIVYADKYGNIGYSLGGKIPIRANNNKNLSPSYGWNNDNDWIGFIPFDEKPFTFNPASGIVVSANSKIVGDDYKYYLGNYFMSNTRAKAIEKQLLTWINDGIKIDIHHFEKLQADKTSVHAKRFANLIESREKDLNLLKNSEKINKDDITWAINTIKSDLEFTQKGQLSANSVAASIYEVSMFQLHFEFISEIADKEIASYAMGYLTQFKFVKLGFSHYASHWHDNLLKIYENNDNTTMIIPRSESDLILAHAITRGVEWLRLHFGINTNKNNWKWGELHALNFPHPLGQLRPLDIIFSRGPYPFGGDMHTVAQNSWSPFEPFKINAWAVSYRQIVDLNSMERSISIHGPGQSGIISSSHYDDFIDLYINDKYHPMIWSDEQIKLYLESNLTLQTSN
eukprot:TRINITY_DN69_c0_g1_i1.p1 TRINITY_DN69_c0_g1~~TRINITY_DN69_c0_g1_i1.p1  ORF type:complete len:927 (-),score=370.82 TRINITY_DN69_c0_g1_i1:60-2795(-)